MGHWFEPIADHLGSAYLRYSFTMGTTQEVDYLVDALGLGPGARLLDVGCGPGRHSFEFARRGIEVVGLDISERFVRIARDGAPRGARFVRGDARHLPFVSAFDAAVSLCQGGFGLLDGVEDDTSVLAGIHRALKPGGRLALSAFSAYFQVRYLEESVFDADSGINHEHTSIRSETGQDRTVELHTTCYTPRELRLILRQAGFVVTAVSSVEPGRYGAAAPTIESPEFLVVSKRP
ncbi:MAG: class I SAM-dependent methyltransferase [Acidimicrobiia bacterium]